MKYQDQFIEKSKIIEPELNKLGYLFFNLNTRKDILYSNGVSLFFKNENLQMIFSYSISKNTGNIYLEFSMDSILENEKLFFLSYYIKDNLLEDKFELNYSPEISIDIFFENFFNELSKGFKTYLKDQVEGKIFTNHNNRLMDSYYNTPGVYQGLVDTVNEYKMDYDAPYFVWLWWKIKRFIIRLFNLK